MDIATKASELRALSDEELVEMFKGSLLLGALQEGGVDNWDWHDDALGSYFEKLEAAGLAD